MQTLKQILNPQPQSMYWVYQCGRWAEYFPHRHGFKSYFNKPKGATWVDECPDITDEMMGEWIFEGCGRQRRNQQAQGEDPTATMKIRSTFNFNPDLPEGVFYRETMKRMKEQLSVYQPDEVFNIFRKPDSTPKKYR